MFGVLDFAPAQLPADRPRYLMGVGKPDDLVCAVARGVDMFDCVLPTRSGRHEQAFTWDGPVNIRNAKHAEDQGERKSVVEGKSVLVRVDLGGRRLIKQKHERIHTRTATRDTRHTTIQQTID